MTFGFLGTWNRKCIYIYVYIGNITDNNIQYKKDNYTAKSWKKKYHEEGTNRIKIYTYIYIYLFYRFIYIYIYA